MIRVVLAVAMATALVAASLPAIDGARRDRTVARLDATVERVERAAVAIATAEDPTPPGVPGARRPLAVRLPARSWSAVGVDWVAVGGTPTDAPGPDGNASLVAYRLDGGPARRHRLPRLDIRTPGGAVVLREAGRHRLRLALVRTGTGPAVVVDRAAERVVVRPPSTGAETSVGRSTVGARRSAPRPQPMYRRSSSAGIALCCSCISCSLPTTSSISSARSSSAS